jgi:hypothetical protein
MVLDGVPYVKSLIKIALYIYIKIFSANCILPIFLCSTEAIFIDVDES